MTTKFAEITKTIRKQIKNVKVEAASQINLFTYGGGG